MNCHAYNKSNVCMYVYKTIIIDTIKYSTGIANHYNGIAAQLIMLNPTNIDE